MAGKFPFWNCRQLERRLKEIGCELIRTSGGHRHYSNPFRSDRLVTFAWHGVDVPRGIVADERVLFQEVLSAILRQGYGWVGACVSRETGEN